MSPKLVRTSCLAVLLPAVLAAVPASAGVVAVGPLSPDYPYEYGSVWEGVQAAGEGDVVHVSVVHESGTPASYGSFDIGLRRSARNLVLSWGNSPAALNILGDVNVGPTATLLFELAGTDNGSARTSGVVSYDTLLVSGSFFVDGTLRVVLIDAFVPSIGDRFELVSTGGSVSTGVGSIASHLSLPDLGPLAAWRITVGTGSGGGESVFATVIPAPGVLGCLAMAAVGGRSRRRGA